MRDEADIIDVLTTYPAGEVFTTTVTRAEVRYGIARLPEGARKRSLEAAADGVFSTFGDRWLSFDIAAADAYGKIVADREHLGRPIAALDAQIAAIALTRRAAVATCNVRDFEHCGVEIVNPFDP